MLRPLVLVLVFLGRALAAMRAYFAEQNAIKRMKLPRASSTRSEREIKSPR
jgi:hypothetical protein